MINMLVGVYGTLKRGNGNNRVLGDSSFVQEARVSGFRLFTSGIPFAYEDITSPYPISVEVFHVTSEDTLHSLDRLEGHPDFYERKPFTVQGLDKDVWIYTCNKPNIPRLEELTDGVY